MLTQTIPTVAIAPLLVLWFGYDMAPKVVPIVVTTFFPIAVGLLGGFRSVDPDQIDLMRSMGASRLQIMRHVKLPAAMPQFFSGLKISAAYAVVGAVFAEWLGGFSGLGVYVAQKKGFYKDAGLEVKIVQGPENGADSLVATGEGDFGVSFQDTMASYVVGAGALPVTAIAAIIQHNTSGIISLKDKGITSPVKIAGHTYATWETPIEQGIIKRCVEADGSDYNQVKMIPSTVADEVSALKTDQVDCIWIFWAWAGEKCELAGLATNYFMFKDFDATFDYYTPVIIANNDLIKNDPDTVQAFMDATRKGSEYCVEHRDDAAKILVDEVPELDLELVRASQEYLADQHTADADAWGRIDPDRWDAFYALISENGISEEQIPVGAGLTMQFQK